MKSKKPLVGERTRLFLARQIRWLHRLYPRPLEACPDATFKRYDFGQPLPNTSPIPRIIWAYWNGAQLPLLVRQCFENWRRFNPAYQINILNDGSLREYLPDMPAGLLEQAPARRSDWMRLELLRRYGGIWLDASTILTQSLDWVGAQQQGAASDFVGFYLNKFTQDPDCPVVESWFMAAPPGSPFIEAVAHEFANEAIARGAEEYIAWLQEQGNFERLRQGIEDPVYLNIHMAMQHVLRKNGNYRLALSAAEDGPFYYLACSRWNRDRLRIRLLCRYIHGPLAPLIKLRGPDRKGMDMYMDQRIHLPGSITQQFLLPQESSAYAQQEMERS